MPRRRRHGLIPTQRGVIIMSAGIHHAIVLVIIGQIGIIVIAVKGELQNLHTRQVIFFPQGGDFRGNDTQVLSHKGQTPVAFQQCTEKFVPRRLHPASVDRSFLISRDLPVGLKTTEMIDADDIE